MPAPPAAAAFPRRPKTTSTIPNGLFILRKVSVVLQLARSNEGLREKLLMGVFLRNLTLNVVRKWPRRDKCKDKDKQTRCDVHFENERRQKNVRNQCGKMLMKKQAPQDRLGSCPSRMRRYAEKLMYKNENTTALYRYWPRYDLVPFKPGVGTKGTIYRDGNSPYGLSAFL